jgi:DNA polymerase-3 subunit gamma/tau
LACVQPGSEKRNESVVDERVLEEILGLAERQVLYDLSNAVIQGNARQCIELIAKIVVEGRDLGRLSRDLVEHFRNLLVVRLAKADAKEAEAVAGQLLDLPDQEIEDLRTQVADISTETLLDYFDFMAIGDEEVNRSANPRFPLETVLVRLATLPKTLPITQLLERLEKLEKSLSRAERPASTLVQAVVAPTPQAVASAAPVGGSFAGDKDNLWQSFVSFVGREKKFLASHLTAGSALELPPGQLKIAVAERHHLNYLQDPDNLSLLKNLAKRFFGDDVAVHITAVSSETLGHKDETTRSETKSQGDEGSAMVKEALRIFGGSIKTVRRENG